MIKKKRYTYQNDFEMLIVRHEYLSKVENRILGSCSNGRGAHPIFSNMSFDTPQSGQIQSSGIFSNDVPGDIPASGSPFAGS